MDGSECSPKTGNALHEKLSSAPYALKGTFDYLRLRPRRAHLASRAPPDLGALDNGSLHVVSQWSKRMSRLLEQRRAQIKRSIPRSFIEIMLMSILG